ncbi:MAG: hypothetical protein CSB55_05820 [Candidatus Cloacimonadota bacterium]|nr:MAG: hypothetical protein CSB55_05820 [Candidatus Cloacimonadota bacterium]
MNRKKNHLYFEIGTSQLNKHGEILCGDSIITDANRETATAILSDGLGSGVKANILSTLTSKILSVMLRNDCPLEEVVSTLVQTLPTCSIRQLAYSTFSVAQFYSKGSLHLVQYDNPPILFIRRNKVREIAYQESKMHGKIIKEAELDLEEGDIFVLMSDGEVHAGICNTLNFGWSWENIADFTERISSKPLTSREIAFELTNVANKLYGEEPGDDTSVIVVKVRQKRYLSVMVGAPKDKNDDAMIVREFMEAPGRKVICGGTTGNIVARELNRKIEVDLSGLKEGIPPVGKLEGIDLCTEGIITISKTLKELQRDDISYKKLEINKDGVTGLIKELTKADDVTFYMGQAINPAHQTANMPMEFGLKTQIMEKIGEILRKKGKHIVIKYA